MTAADICRERGWRKGTLLVGREEYSEGNWRDDAIEITAVGIRGILARKLGHRTSTNPAWVAKPENEAQWTLEYRDWHAIPHLPWETPSNTNEKEKV